MRRSVIRNFIFCALGRHFPAIRPSQLTFSFTEGDEALIVPCKSCIAFVYPMIEQRNVMRTQVAKWGNSLGVRIPKAYAEEIGIAEGATLEIKRSGRKLVLIPTQPEYALSRLVSGITRKNRHEETNWGHPVGRETW
jgi:antitoxin MazE